MGVQLNLMLRIWLLSCESSLETTKTSENLFQERYPKKSIMTVYRELSPQNLDCLVLVAIREYFSISTEANRSNITGLPSRCVQQLSSIQIPNFDNTTSATGKRSSIWADGDRVNPI